MRVLPLHYYIPTITGLIKNYFYRKMVYPFYASFKITSRCQFSCPFCNIKKDKVKDLSTEEVKKILDNLSRSSVLMTSFEGGEPLLRDDIGELLHHAKKCMFYLLFTTSVRNIMEYRMEEYSRHIDFLHVSIDEGHENLEMFDLLPELVKLSTRVSVQVVVAKDTINTLEKKVDICYKAGAKVVVIPASPMEGAEDCFPDILKLEKKVHYLNKKYPDSIHTPNGYFNAYRKNRCSSASVIIAPDGYLYYPCHILEEKGPDLRKIDLTTWLNSQEASAARQKMKVCKKNCGWYQYYSIDSYLSPWTFLKSLGPILIQKKREN